MDDYDIPELNNLWNEYSNIFNFMNPNFNIFENPYQSIKRLNKFNYFSDIYKINKNYEIPKIIHQIAPKNESNWHELWKTCQDTWKLKFPEYEYKLWSDEEDIENLIKTDFPFFYDIFMSYPHKIQRIDMARYFILIKYGGIYVDMDFYCYKNFYDFLDKSKINIPYSPWNNVEILQNSLMASPQNNLFLLHVIDEAIRRKSISSISISSGPKLISDVYERNTNLLNALKKELYNPICSIYVDSEIYNENTCYCKHYGTGQW